MGLRSCDRAGCGSPMSDYYSPEYGDLCGDCFEQLCASNLDPDLIRVFMLSPSVAAQISYRPIYEQIFRKHYIG